MLCSAHGSNLSPEERELFERLRRHFWLQNGTPLQRRWEGEHVHCRSTLLAFAAERRRRHRIALGLEPAGPEVVELAAAVVAVADRRWAREQLRQRWLAYWYGRPWAGPLAGLLAWLGREP